MTPGVVVLVAAVAVALALGLWRAGTDGRFRGTHRVRESGHVINEARVEPVATALDGTELASQLGKVATLVQFSTVFCAPCRTTRRILDDVAAAVPGVRHLDIDAEHHLDLVRRLGVTRTPTTLVLDAAGREVSRAQGVPTRQQVLAALSRL